MPFLKTARAWLCINTFLSESLIKRMNGLRRFGNDIQHLNNSTNKPHYWATTRDWPYPALLKKLD